MKAILFCIALFLGTNAHASGTKDNFGKLVDKKATSFGSPITLKKAIPLKEAVSAKKAGQLLVTAKVGKVCESKGCWMSLESTDKSVRVTFKDYKFFVPMSLVGKKVLVQGVLSPYKMSIKEAKHYASDAGKDPSKIKKAVLEYRMVATGVKTL
ncbi:MAG: DUF4920 domain-containing protein [Halobacteriovoraceae bacterium]|jgi:hypothetical protein|nr:DUF4920 domain-containing protein [Halobacteriovoraceae bacterium]MBT5095090.1 DUF4920 domain-containing protein [Halobacteriovoraceae bacterium]